MTATGTARSCDGCTACCKLMIIRELDKPADKWCSHCKIGSGCSIYATRPAVCAAFKCVWLQTQDGANPLAPELRPDISHVVMSTAHDSKDIVLNVSATRPDAWKTGAIRQLVDHWMSHGVKIIVKCRDKVVKVSLSS